VDHPGTAEVELAYLIDKSRWVKAFHRGRSRHNPARPDRVASEAPHLLIMPWQRGVGRRRDKGGMALEREHTGEFGLCHVYSRALE